MTAVYVQTNDADENAVVAYTRAADGSLTARGSYPTGGRGSGQPHLPSQGSLAVAGGHLLVANAGSDDVSLFAIDARGEPRLASRTASGGSEPRSIAVHGDLVYVLNTGEPNVAGFRLVNDELRPLGTTQPAGSDPAQVGFSPDGRTVVVTDRADTIHVYAVAADGTVSPPAQVPSAGATPYGFAFTSDGTLVVTEAAGGEIGAASASSYRVAGAEVRRVSEAVGDTRSEVCWAAIAADRHAYVTNFGDGTISRYTIADDGSLELAEPVAATTVMGAKGIRDEALSADGRYLYALDADARQVFGWRVGDDGSLTPVGASDGLPATAAGLAVS
jgi:6-phosphogluconolactonase (cycloisomerase 2 family)